MKLHLTSNVWSLMPIILSSITATMASLIKFRNFNQRMEIYLQSASLLTNTLLKARNHDSLDDELKSEYNQALEKIETALYPSERKVFIRISQRNLIDIMAQEQKYYDKIDKVNNNIIINSSSESTPSDSPDLDASSHRTNPLRNNEIAAL